MITQAIGCNSPKAKALARSYDFIESFFRLGESEWRRCGFLSPKEVDRLIDAKEEDALRIIDRCEQLGYSVLTINDAEYPQNLYSISSPPAVLYISGKLPDFDEHLSIGVVGTRKASRYGVENSYKIAYALAKYDTVIVSGGALGVDCASHRGALAANGITVCVRGCGINSRYLRDNIDMRNAITSKGAVISEYPPDTEPRNFYFPARNRIIAGLSKGMLIIEAGEKSGSLITANDALKMGRNVFALMGNNFPENEGSNQLIKTGKAVPVTDFADILSFYDRKRSKREPFPGIDNLSLMDIDAVPVKGKKSVSDNAKPAQKAAKPKAKKVKAEPKAKKAEAEPQPAAPVHRTDIDLDGDSKRIYEFLSAEPVHIDTIAVSLDLPVNRALGALTLLEVKGLVRALQGRHYVIV